MIRTLRARLTLLNIGIVSVAVALFAALLYGWLARTLNSHHDVELADDAQRIVEGAATAEDPLGYLTALDAAEKVGPLVLVRNQQGQTLFRSTRLAASAPDVGEHTALQHAAMAGVTAPQFFSVTLQRGAPVRFICVPLRRPEGTYLQLGRRLGDVDVLLGVVRIASLALIPLVILGTSFAAFLIAGRALAPIGHMAATLESIQATDLNRRVTEGPSDQEVRRLSSSINHLLDRLERSFRSLREFTADVSHQLRTPLSVMKGTVEMARGRERTAAETDLALQQLAEEVDALAATVQEVSEVSVAGTEIRHERVDLSEVFQEAGELILAYAESHGVGCDLTIAPSIVVSGSRIGLRQLLLNLGENAIQFTPEASGIRIALARQQDRAVLTVRDEGVGIAADSLPRVFERRYSTDGVRSSAGGGLGLALVKRIVEAHRGAIAIESAPSQGTTVRVEFPLAT